MPIAQRAHANRQAVFADATAGWKAEDRGEFARLLTRFVADFQAVSADRD
ncbi:hypothetical protein [Nocardia sp. NPDC004722]